MGVSAPVAGQGPPGPKRIILINLFYRFILEQSGQALLMQVAHLKFRLFSMGIVPGIRSPGPESSSWTYNSDQTYPEIYYFSSCFSTFFTLLYWFDPLFEFMVLFMELSVSRFLSIFRDGIDTLIVIGVAESIRFFFSIA